MNKLKEAIAAALREMGFQAQPGLPWKKAGPLEKEKICVCIRRAEARGNPVQSYMGMDDQGQEHFSMGLKVEIGLVLLSPREKGEEGCEALAEQVFDSLLTGSFSTEELLLGACSYDGLRDCFTAEIRMVSQVLLNGVRQDGGSYIEDFEIRAVRQNQ